MLVRPLIAGFRHTGITVKDMERALAFYGGLLGLTLSSDRISPDGGQFVGAPGASIRICVLDAPGASAVIELVEYRNADGAPISAKPVDPGSGHASFWVSDIERLYTTLVEQGIRVLSGPIEPASGRKKFYAQDPDGFWLELTEVRPAS
jgi:catechol 2,3-dioxygenase-like lactoylglutathione lyase family enzyme